MLRKDFNTRWEALKSERSYWLTYWQDLADFVDGYKGRWLNGDKGKPRRNTRILNNTGKLASRTLASGMMAGVTSPARPWFKLGTPDPDLAEYAPVKQWLHDVERIMLLIFAKSNFYNSMFSVYRELGNFATSAMGIYEDYDNVIRCHTYTVGSYALGLDGADRVDTFYREYEQTVGQVVKQFGIENVSSTVRNLWNNGNTEAKVPIIHAVEPNDKRNMMSPLAKDLPVRSVYYEAGDSRAEAFLKLSGFEEFPILAPRWDLTDADTYGTNCPGMDSLGDIKALQLEEKRKAQAIDKMVDPPTQTPVKFRHQVQEGGFQPGDNVFVDSTADGIKSIYDMQIDMRGLLEDIQATEHRIKRAFYEDLFLMLANSTRRQVTAREVEERHEEKLIMLGPVLERVHHEALDPAIDRTFAIGMRGNVFPPPPPEVQGKNLRVEYISVLAQAQRLTAVTGIERVAGYAANLSTVWPEARHKFNASQSVDEYALAVGISPDMVRPDKEAEAMAKAEQQQAAAANAAAMAPAAKDAAQAAKTVSETDGRGDNLLADLLRQSAAGG